LKQIRLVTYTASGDRLNVRAVMYGTVQQWTNGHS